MGLKKQQLNSKSVCKVTFELAKEATASAKEVYLVGDFNSWDTNATPMKKHKDGTFRVTMSLEKGCEYQYRYLIDGKTWENDWCADKYVPSLFGDHENSVVIL
ncbi:MAG: isoamylase early set domain-containing protein [Desulfomonilia bacterium]|jgi:1,4-alpha-glucan branching enzyme